MRSLDSSAGSASASTSRRLFVALLLAAAAIRLLFVAILPDRQTVRHRVEGLNDEASHYNYILYLAEERRLPVQSASARDPDAFDRNEYEYYQPPVYYLAGAVLYALFGSPASFYLARLLSLLLGLASFPVVWRIFQRLGYPREIRVGAILFLAFLPCHAYFTSFVSNDALTWLLALLITYPMMDARTFASRGAPAALGRRSTALFFLLAVGLLTKSSILLFFPPVGLFYLYGFWKTKDRRFLWQGALVLFGSLAVVSPWYARNIQLYGSWSAIEVGNGPAQRYLFQPDQIEKFLKNTTRYFWFPMQHLLPTNGRRVIWGIGAILLAMNAALVARWFRARRRLEAEEVLLLALFVGNVFGYVRYNILWRNAEGRFFFVTLTAVLLFFTVPLYDFLRARDRTAWFVPILLLEALWPYLNLLLPQYDY